MGQRLFKAIYFIVLIVSVSFCFSFTALADETSSGDELVAYVDTVENTQYFDLSVVADLMEDDYTGSAVFQVLSQRGSMYFQYQAINGSGYNYLGAYVVPVYLTIGFQVEMGHTYSGAVSLPCHTKISLDDNFNEGIDSNLSVISSCVFSGYTEISPESVDVSLYPVLGANNEFDYTVNINFNNYQSTFNGYVYCNVILNFDMSTTVYNNYKQNWTQRSVAVVNTHATDWAGTLKDFATDAIIDSDGSLIKNQTIQQQQIANQQSQQSAQQHDNLVNGYDNAANDSMLADKNSVLQGFEQQQDQAISGGQQYVADYSSSFSTALLQAMAPAFMMISTWFNDLWSGMGNFSTVPVVGLMLCVAGYILKLKH